MEELKESLKKLLDLLSVENFNDLYDNLSVSKKQVMRHHLNALIQQNLTKEI